MFGWFIHIKRKYWQWITLVRNLLTKLRNDVKYHWSTFSESNGRIVHSGIRLCELGVGCLKHLKLYHTCNPDPACTLCTREINETKDRSSKSDQHGILCIWAEGSNFYKVRHQNIGVENLLMLSPPSRPPFPKSFEFTLESNQRF